MAGSEKDISSDRLLKELEELRWRVSEISQISQEREEAELALRESESRYRDLVQSISEYLYSVQFKNGKQTSVYHSPQCEMITGYKPLDYYSDPDLWIKMVHPDDRAKVTAFLRDTISLKKGRSIEHRIIHKNGSIKWVSNHCTVTVDDKNELLRQNGFLLDITELKDAEKEKSRLYTAIEQTADIVMITNTDGIIQYVNQVFEKITGYTREEVIGKNPRILKSGAHDNDYYKKVWDTITSGEIWTGTFVNRSKDGSLYEEYSTISPIKDETGRITNFVAVKRDVTREAALTKAREYFTAVTSHELRTPLIKLDLLRMLISNLEEKIDDKETLNHMNKVIDNIYHGIDGVVSATTLISELNASRARGSFTKTPIYFLILSSVESARASIAKEGRNLAIELDLAKLPRESSVMGEQKLLARAVSEALSNAIKYTEDGRKIWVSGKLDGQAAVLTIRDEGIGIPVAKRGSIFEPYYSLEDPIYYTSSKHKFKGGGIGLGLTVARMIMDVHGGRLAVESEGENKGTAVTITLNCLSQ